MSRDEKPHWDVAAYALGVLDPRELPRYEQHLANCPTCAAELERLLPVTHLLADVDPNELRNAEEIQLADRLVQMVQIDRRRARARQRLAVAAGTVVVVAVAVGALLVGVNVQSQAPVGDPGIAAGPTAETASPSPAEPSPTSTAEDDLGEGERFTATDPETGVEAEVVLATKDWGTKVSVALSSVTGPRVCQLLLAPHDGSTQVLANWRVPEEGYGTPEQSKPLVLQTATALDISDIDHLQVQVIDDGGGITALVTVPM